MTDIEVIERLTEETNRVVRGKYADPALCVHRRAPDWSDRKAKPLAGQVIRAVRAAMPDRAA